MAVHSKFAATYPLHKSGIRISSWNRELCLISMGKKFVGKYPEIRIIELRPVRPLTRCLPGQFRGEGEIQESPDFIGAPRPMKMGTIASPWRYDVAPRHALDQTNMREPAISHSAPVEAVDVTPSHSSGASENRDRPQCDIAHQSDLGHVPSVDERFRNERKLAPAQIGLRRRLAHP
jgi:hypothetical protein